MIDSPPSRREASRTLARRLADWVPRDMTTTLRFRWLLLAFGLPLAAGTALAQGSQASFYATVVIATTWALANLALTRVLKHTTRQQTVGTLFLILDFLGITCSLTLFGQLEGPFITVYFLLVLGGAAIWAGRATVIASAAGLGFYVIALVLVHAGILPEAIALAPQQSSESIGFVGPLIVFLILLTCAGITAAMSLGPLHRQISTSEDRYRVIFEAVREPTFIFDVETRQCVDANPAALSLVGIPHEELVTLNAFDLASKRTNERMLEWVRKSERRTPRSAVQRIVARDGTERFMEVAISRTEFGGRGAFVVSLKDRTERIRLDEERKKYAETLEAEVARRTEDLERTNQELRDLQTRLVEAERLGTAGEVAGGIAHAIYNPITVLIGKIQMRLEAVEQPDPEDELILRLAQRIVAIVDGMLTLSRRGTMMPEWVSPLRIIADVCEELRERCEASGVEIDEDADPRTAELLADRVLLTAALARIAENAVDAMPDGGTLRLGVEQIPGTEVMCFRIQDTGPGIPKELQAQILRPFFTTKLRGTGLGLAIARGIIQGHEGVIHFESKQDVGTTVTVELPLRGVRESLIQQPS